MGKSAKQPTEQQVTTTTSNLPEYARPYYENLVQRAQAISNQAYVPFGYTQDDSGQVVRAVDPATGQPVNAQRLAGFTPEQTAVQNEILGRQTQGQFQLGSNLAGAAGLASLDAGQFDPTTFSRQMVTPQQLREFQMGGPDMFGQEQVDRYMSPYVQNVLDVSKRKAVEDAQRTQLMQNLGAARQGSYGGARQLLAGTERERALGQNLSDIQTTGLQSAFENAQQQFERDRAARMGVDRTNLEAMLGVQQLGSQQGLQAALANQQSDIEAQRLSEQSRQFGSQQGLAGLAQALQGAQTLGNLGQMEAQTEQARLAQQTEAAAQRQALDQQRLDLAYSDFLRQRDYPMEQLNYLNSIIRGLPVNLSSTQTAYATPPSLASQVGGLGLGALGLYNMQRSGG